MKTVDNLIGGQSVNLGKNYFTVQSQFYKDKILIADASQLDISIALSKAKQSWEECQKLSFAERANIIKKAANSLKFSEGEIRAIVKMVGMPKKYISEQVNQIPKIMASFWEIISKRYGFLYGKIGLDFMENETFHKIEFRVPKKGFVYAITPGNDPRITAVVSTILVLLGIPGIIKPSKTDNIVPLKIVKTIIDAGYPKNGLSILFFDSENPKSKEHNFKICDEAATIWPFGDENTIDNLIRTEKRNVLNLDKFLKDKGMLNIQKELPKFLAELQKAENSLNDYISTQTIDHFASKLILRHASGRCAGILDENFDIPLAAKLIIDSSMRYPIGCNSMKSVFVVESSFNKLTKVLERELTLLDKHTADPLNPKTEVGYIDKRTALFLEKRIDELKRLQLISILHGGEKISPTQFTPLLVSTNDVNSELLINEIPGYILCLIKVKSFEEAVSQINRIAQDSPKLAVGYFTNNPQNMRLYVNAHHIKINHLTTDLDGIIHEGNDYIMQLTRPYMVHVHKANLKEHPYPRK